MSMSSTYQGDALDIMNAEIRNKGIEVTGTSQIEYLSDINTSVDLVLIWCEENEIFDSWDVGMKNAQELINSADVRFELIEYYFFSIFVNWHRCYKVWCGISDNPESFRDIQISNQFISLINLQSIR